jgi:hypothetical protein
MMRAGEKEGGMAFDRYDLFALTLAVTGLFILAMAV